jgi:hypothetical protein
MLKKFILLYCLFVAHNVYAQPNYIYHFKVEEKKLTETQKAQTLSEIEKRLESIYIKNATVFFDTTSNLIIKNTYAISIDFIKNNICNEQNGELVFYEVYNLIDFVNSLNKNKLTKKQQAALDSLLVIAGIDKSSQIPRQAELFNLNIKDSSIFLNYFKVLKPILPKDIIFKFGKAADEQNYITFYGLIENTFKLITTNKIVESFVGYDPNGRAEINVSFNETGAKQFALLTEKNINMFVAIVANNVVLSAPRVNSKIDGGKLSISGNFTAREATELASSFTLGHMPTKLKFLKSEIN